jgi:hypothetical protein
VEPTVACQPSSRALRTPTNCLGLRRSASPRLFASRHTSEQIQAYHVPFGASMLSLHVVILSRDRSCEIAVPGNALQIQKERSHLLDVGATPLTCRGPIVSSTAFLTRRLKDLRDSQMKQARRLQFGAGIPATESPTIEERFLLRPQELLLQLANLLPSSSAKSIDANISSTRNSAITRTIST